MNALKAIVREVVGLFVEDGSLALAIVGLVAAAVLISGLGAPPAAIGILLLAGSLGVLVENVLRAWRKTPSSSSGSARS
jgi:hypothetical protein